MSGKYNPSFDPTLLLSQTAAVTEDNVTSVAEVKAQPNKTTRGRKSNAENASFVYIRNFPRELLNQIKLIFPGLSNQADILTAFVLWQMGSELELSTYKPPAHIEEAVYRIREVSGTGSVEALGTNMSQLRTKLHAISDQVLCQQMLLSYLITVSSGLHAPGRIYSGDDLKLIHEHVFSTTYAALGDFAQYKQIVKDHEGRPRKPTSQKKKRSTLNNG